MVSTFISRVSGKQIARFLTLAIMIALVLSLVGSVKPATASGNPFISSNCCDIYWKTAFSNQFTAGGGSGSGYTYSVTGGTLPTGLVLTSTGLLSGTSSARGAYSFTVTVTDSLSATGSTLYSSTIKGINVVLTPGVLPNPTSAGATYNVRVYANMTNTGVTAPVTFTSGNLPGWLSLSSGSGNTAGQGLLSGTPVAGTYSFTITATDANGYTGSINYTITIPTTLIPPGLNQQICVGQTLTPVQFSTGDGGPDTWALSVGSLAPGMNFSSTGLYSGSPTNNGTYVFYIAATNTSTNVVSTFKLVQQVNLCPNLRIVATPDATQSNQLNVGNGAAVSIALTMTNQGGQVTPPFTWTVPGGTDGSLPGWLTLTPSGGNNTSATLSGTAATGNYVFKVYATDSVGNVANIVIYINVS